MASNKWFGECVTRYNKVVAKSPVQFHLWCCIAEYGELLGSFKGGPSYVTLRVSVETGEIMHCKLAQSRLDKDAFSSLTETEVRQHAGMSAGT